MKKEEISIKENQIRDNNTGDNNTEDNNTGNNSSVEITVNLSRRKFIFGVAIAGTGAAFGVFPSISESAKLQLDDGTGQIQDFMPNVWVSIDSDNIATITISRQEMGQGIRTALAMCLADELDADWSQVRVVQAQADENKYGGQGTGGSGSITGRNLIYRNAGAAIRKMFMQAAAQKWGVNENSCHTELGTVIETGGNRSAAYGELIDIAETLPIPGEGSYSRKTPDEFTIIGKDHGHIDEKDIVTGKAVFGTDVRIEGMKFAVMARPPARNAYIRSFDDTESLKVPGVIEVIRVGSKIAVIADNTWAAITGRSLLSIDWNTERYQDLNSESIRNEMVSKIGNLGELSGNTVKSIEVQYEVPFLAHATMEPMNATARIENGECEVWVPTQSPGGAYNTAKSTSGAAKTTVNVTLLGGGFGRRLSNDYVTDSVAVSKAFGGPVQVMMTRDDDIRNDRYRPASIHAMKGGVDADGNITGWIHRGIYSRSGSVYAPPYNIDNKEITDDGADIPIPTGAWRSVSYTQYVFANECFIDELAFLAGKDPYQMRVDLCSDTRLKNVIIQAAEKSGWGSPLPSGSGRGIAGFVGYGGRIAHVIEVTVDDSGRLTIDKVTAVVDVGLAINPDNVKKQVEGSLIDGLSTAMKSEITIDKGGIVQSNFDSFKWLRMSETPETNVHILSGSSGPSGMGEVGFPSVTPALCNAIFNATGIRVRKLPISKTDLSLTSVEAKKKGEITITARPNPFAGSFVLEGQLDGVNQDRVSQSNIEISFLNITGVEVFKTRGNLNGQGHFSESIQLPNLSAGIYFCRVNSGNINQMIKLIKK